MGRNRETCVMVKAAPAAAFVVAEADLLLEFEIVAFDPPADRSDRPSACTRCLPALLKASCGPGRFRPPITRSAATLQP